MAGDDCKLGPFLSADRAARRLAAAGFLEMSDLMMLANTSLCESAGVNVSKLVPNFAHRLKIISSIQQGMLQQTQVGGLGAQVANGLNVSASAGSNWRTPSEGGLGASSLTGPTSSAWLPHAIKCTKILLNISKAVLTSRDPDYQQMAMHICF